jgi:zona occludens toxin
LGDEMIGRSLHRQRGFVYLSTGANGTGKTLFTLRDVRTLQLETNRPVYFSGFTPKQPIHDFGWKPFDPEKWQDLPDGSICLVDECQTVMPVRGTGKPPAWIGAIAEVHRKRGFDFFLLTQHPLNLDAFVRRTIASPGWHRHFKASTMADSSNELKWTAVVDNPQRPGSGDSGEVRTRPFDKEVYDWYESASVHTAKKGIPLKMWLAGGGLLAAALMIGYVAWSFIGQTKPTEQPEVEKTPVSTPMTVAAPPASSRSEKAPLTAAEYAAAYAPRINGLEHTAPAYDALTQPKVVPLPAACIQWSGKGCKCFTQRGTPYQTTEAICLQVVKHGIFLPFEEDLRVQASDRTSAPPGEAPPAQKAVLR